MAQWIEVKARCEKTLENGQLKTVTEAYLVDALSCTEAEARITNELAATTGEFSIISCGKTKIYEVFNLHGNGDRFYKVKINWLTIDEKTGVEKKTPCFMLVRASDFITAYTFFVEDMKGTLADFEIEQICETKIVDVYEYHPATDTATIAPQKLAEKIASDDSFQQHAQKLHEAVPGGTRVSMSATTPDGATIVPETVVIDKTSPYNDNN